MSKSSSEPNAAIDYWEVFRELPEAYLLVEANDPVFTIVSANDARIRLTGGPYKQVAGRPLFEVFPDKTEKFLSTGVSDVLDAFRLAIRTGKSQSLHALRYDLPTTGAKNRERYWESTYVPLALGSKKITHVLASTREITDTVLSKQRMTNAEERLEAALSIGKVGSWVWDVKNDSVLADKNLLRMFGLPQKYRLQGVPLNIFLHAIHEEDRAGISAAIKHALRTKGEFEQEYRTYDARGKVRWVLARGRFEERDGRNILPGVIVDITERRDLQAQVELAHKQDALNRRASKILLDRNSELEAIGRTKDEFVALASHQLRTPATAVKQYVGMVLQGYVGDMTQLQTEMLERAFESNERQIQIINQILNAARVDTGRLIMTPIELDLVALVQGIADDMRSSLEQRSHTFSVSLPKHRVLVMADLGYVRMAIENLVHNASIYTPEGGTITLKLVTTGTQAKLSVTDNGVGIKKADVAKLFAKFSRIHNPLSVQAGGSGIGLYLTAEIIRLHGGRVSVDSKIRVGSTFAISLPLAL